MMINNKEAFEKALKTLTENDRKTLEAFASFLLVSSNSSLNKDNVKPVSSTGLLDKANNALLKDYTKVDLEKIEYSFHDDSFETISFFIKDREKSLNFPSSWFVHGNYNLTNNLKSLFVKFRSGSNRIDKIAVDGKLLTDFGKTHCQKRILVLNSPIISQPDVNPAQTSAQFVSQLIDTKITGPVSDGWTNTPAIVQISVPKSNPAFSKLASFKEGRLRLSRVGEILFNFLDQTANKKYVWDSEFFFGAPHDFTDLKTNKTYDVKCHFHASERLQISQQTLDRCDADFIVAVLVEEDDTSYTATVSGYISRVDFTNKTKPWAYNEYVELRSLDLHGLNSPKDLF